LLASNAHTIARLVLRRLVERPPKATDVDAASAENPALGLVRHDEVPEEM
jgi:hypothetical protein